MLLIEYTPGKSINFYFFFSAASICSSFVGEHKKILKFWGATFKLLVVTVKGRTVTKRAVPMTGFAGPLCTETVAGWAASLVAFTLGNAGDAEGEWGKP